jgi:hypothetical protein
MKRKNTPKPALGRLDSYYTPIMAALAIWELGAGSWELGR